MTKILLCVSISWGTAHDPDSEEKAHRMKQTCEARQKRPVSLL
jgi:hypothetical protein